MTLTKTTAAAGGRQPSSTDSASAANGGRCRAAAAVLLACAALASGGCGTLDSRPATGNGSQAGESGVTVFGTVDVGVGGVRSSK